MSLLCVPLLCWGCAGVGARAAAGSSCRQLAAADGSTECSDRQCERMQGVLTPDVLLAVLQDPGSICQPTACCCFCVLQEAQLMSCFAHASTLMDATKARQLSVEFGFH